MIRVGKMGRVRVDGKDMIALRRAVFTRDGWKCCDCGVGVEWTGWNAGHLAHIQSRGAGGSDTEENTRCLCGICHQREHNAGGKPIPRKVR